MARKNITLDIEAYDLLVQARRTPSESFSQVIKRVHWTKKKNNTGANLLSAIMNNPPMSEVDLVYLEKAKKADQPPSDKWKEA